MGEEVYFTRDAPGALPMSQFRSVVYAVIGGVTGLWAGEAGEELLGLFGGALIGALLARLSKLEGRLRELELARLVRPDEPAPLTARSEFKAHAEAVGAGETEEMPAAARETEEPHWSDWEQEPASTEEATTPRVETSLEPSLLEQGVGWLKRWFNEGNVPVKVGVIISFIGFSFLLKYAVDKKLIFLPLEVRLVGVALFGLALSGIGWRLRTRRRNYALSLQGGGIGILFLTVFAAFRIWSLLPPGMAFTLLVLLAFTTGALALLQNARTLAVFATAGGFLAPLLASTGQGSHVTLFSYYLVINGAVLGLAWFRAWRSLNLIGWVFTIVIGCYWGYQYYRPVLFSSTEPFLVVFFLVYNAIAILFALRQAPNRVGLVDGTLVFGTPVVLFAVQAALLRDSEYGLAWSALVLAVFYAIAAYALLRARGEVLRLLVESYQALAVVFLTLAIPLALDARWTAGAWALEGAALIWIGRRQSHHLANLAGSLLVFGAGLAFMDDGWKSGRGLPVLNGNVLGGLLVSLSGLFGSRMLSRFERERDKRFLPYLNAYWLASLALLLWGIAWWLGVGLREALDRTTRFQELHVYLLFLATSVLAAVQIDRLRDWPWLRRAALVLLPFLGLIGTWDLIDRQHLLYGLGWAAWPLAWAAQAHVLWHFDRGEERMTPIWHLLSVLGITALAANELWWQIDQQVSRSWAIAGAVTLAGLTPWLIWRSRDGSAWPVAGHRETYLDASVLVVAAQVLYLTGASLASAGDSAPLPYLPVFNPFDLALLGVGWIAVGSLRTLQAETDRGTASVSTSLRPAYRVLLAVAFFVLTTTALVRGVYHLYGGSWNWESLFESVVVQTSLSIYWAILGFGGMIWGATRKRRPLWLAGAGFMALVVLKLFAVDLTQTGTVERIISFIGVGILLLVVGYFAPAPPRENR